MKNALLVWKKDCYSVFERGIKATVDAFRVGGYLFDEVRVFLDGDERKLFAAVETLLQTYDNLAVVTDQVLYVKTALAAMLGEEFFQGRASGTGIFTQKDKSVFLLSATQFEEGVGYIQTTGIPYLERKYTTTWGRTVVRAIGATERHVQNLLLKARAIDGGKMRYIHTRNYDEDIVEIFYDETVSKRTADDVVRVFADGLQECVYALDDTPLAEQLVQLLRLRSKKISVAESFTGGGIARRLVSVAGASKVYFEGLNTYNEYAKIKRLGVNEYTLQSLGAVSDQTAYEMAASLIGTGDCDISIATTGLAGPATDGSTLPVGLCYVAIGTKERVFVYRYKFDGTREEITEKAIQYALFLAYKQLKNM